MREHWAALNKCVYLDGKPQHMASGAFLDGILEVHIVKMLVADYYETFEKWQWYFKLTTVYMRILLKICTRF